jgi:hypothetical protein
VRGIKHAANFTAAIALSVALAGCTGHPDDQKPNTVVTQAALTDESGHVSFDLRGNTFELNLSDSENAQGASNLLVVLSATNEGGFYYVADPADRYSTMLLGTTPATAIDKVEEPGKVSNVVIERKDTACNRMANFFASGMTPSQLFYHRDAFDDEDNILQSNFGIIEDADNIPLSKLDNTLGLILEGIKDNLTTNAIEGYVTTILSIKIEMFKAAGGLPGWLMLLADICPIVDTQRWADYYRGLCYDDNDKFEIWKLGGFAGLNLKDMGVDTTILANPVLLVLPVDKPDPQAITEDGQWLAPTASIGGRFHEVDGNPLTSTAILEHSESIFPSVQFDIPPSSSEGDFFFIAGACKNYSPTYELKAVLNTPHPVPYSANLSTTLNVAKDDSFSVSFLPGRNCTDADYLTYHAEVDGECNQFDIVVSCLKPENYVPEGQCSIPSTCRNFGHLSDYSLGESEFAFKEVSGDRYQILDLQTNETSEDAENCGIIQYLGNMAKCDFRIWNAEGTEYEIPDISVVGGTTGTEVGMQNLTAWGSDLYAEAPFEYLSYDLIRIHLTTGNYSVISDTGQNPSIHMGNLVYEEDGVIILDNGSRYELSAGFAPKIHGDYVVFRDGNSLMLADISSPVTPLVSEISSQDDPAFTYDISGQMIVIGIRREVLVYDIVSSSLGTFADVGVSAASLRGRAMVFKTTMDDVYLCVLE